MHRPNYNIYNRFLLLLKGSLIFFLLLAPTNFSRGCVPYDTSFKGYTFLNPGLMIPDKSLSEFFRAFQLYFRIHFDPNTNFKKNANLKEWKERFCDLVEIEDLEVVIYQTSVGDLKLLRTAVQSKNIPISTRLKYNTFADFLEGQKCLEVIDYLIFAKQCEPHVAALRGWDPPERDHETMQSLIDYGNKLFRKTNAHYVRLRIAYQMIRLAHYKKDYQQVLELFDFLLPKIDRRKPSLVYYWILGHKAGALQKLKQRAESAYLYNLVFLHCESCRTSALRSFFVKTDEEWKACYLKCENDEERISLFAMRANSRFGKPIEEMKKIYELDPKSPFMESLLYREIMALEQDFLGTSFNDRQKENLKYHSIPRSNAGDMLIEVREFVLKCINEKKVANLNLWKITQGYLALLAGDFYTAGKTFEQLDDQVQKALYKEQLDVFELVLEIADFNTVTDSVERRVYEIMRDNPYYSKYPDFPDFLADKLHSLYVSTGAVGKAFKMKNTLKDLSYNPDLEILDNLIEIGNKETPTKLEEQFLTDENDQNILNDLYLLKGVKLLGEEKLEAALETMKNIPRTERNQYGLFDPFKESINDCVHCPVVTDTSDYNRVELLDRLIELEYLAKADQQNGAQYYYELGLAYYNMSYYGYSWKIMDFFRSGASWGYRNEKNIYPHVEAKLGNKEQKRLNKALGYFALSRELAEGKNPELAAKATFMAARCRQKMYFNSKGADYRPGSNKIPVLPEKFRDYQEIFLQRYKETDFYLEVIEECKYFEAYARQ